MSGRRFPNACTTAPFSTFWLRVRLGRRTGRLDRRRDRVQLALVECSHLLRDVVRELHPDVLARLGLKAALSALTDSLTSRTELTVELDARRWPDGLRTDADYVLYSAARETMTNVIKHAQAHHIWIDLDRDDGLACCVFPTTAWASQKPPWRRKPKKVISACPRFAPRHWRPRDSSTCGRRLREPRSPSRYHCAHFRPTPKPALTAARWWEHRSGVCEPFLAAWPSDGPPRPGFERLIRPQPTGRGAEGTHEPPYCLRKCIRSPRATYSRSRARRVKDDSGFR